MKQIRTVLLMLMAGTLALTSCKKDGGSKTSASMNLSVDGSAKSTSSVIATYYQSEKSLQVIATFSGGASVSFMIQNIKVGSFDASTDEVLATYSTSNSFADTYTGDSGTVTISSFANGTVKGTFAFAASKTGGSTTHITGGTFTAAYTTQ
ncbi:MAG TPA: hypothetical protein VHS53_06765 [Mucilaginibacter sp.]|nr:hypothetical protein [Mucilaginibacter sp.]